MARLLSFLPTICAFIAFILSILCLFAGTKKGLLPGADILTIYTPILAAHNSGMHDFYSIHVMSYCAGFLEFSEMDQRQNVTGCSNRTVLFSFEPSAVMLQETGNTSSLAELGWPVAVSDDFQAFSITSQSMGVFYCIGLGAAGLVILARLWLLISNGPRQTITEVTGLLLSFTSLSIASIVATVIAFQFVDLVNSHGKQSGVTARYGSQFLGMTWAAVGLLLIGGITSLLFVLVDRARPHPKPEEEEVLDEPEAKKPMLEEDSDSVRTKVNAD
ncbi:SUR7/PalI family protein [Aspergillus clavatus NRRL 1]|uniref:Integral membrane protein n=1 Tax=Aspergillus clavatus (strain ATCC 1007 / CBS 513.65 / DSM 816 / NCTC 3887 / NRRL 1 / QM 1276 / 107) TaxID=344612 RepID=A1C6B5_ASPCL|nr:uncharacterized protein ACLA_069660 [Aspergillus clavatus NRRL 1]EAW13936.1 conserved hypothetical protein [Aspergillus clavatus NRRL 1]